LLNLPLDAHQLLTLENLKEKHIYHKGFVSMQFFFLQLVVSFLLFWKKYLTNTELLKAWTHVM
jgi:hypothetical protein